MLGKALARLARAHRMPMDWGSPWLGRGYAFIARLERAEGYQGHVRKPRSVRTVLQGRLGGAVVLGKALGWLARAHRMPMDWGSPWLGWGVAPDRPAALYCSLA